MFGLLGCIHQTSSAALNQDLFKDPRKAIVHPTPIHSDLAGSCRKEGQASVSNLKRCSPTATLSRRLLLLAVKHSPGPCASDFPDHPITRSPDRQITRWLPLPPLLPPMVSQGGLYCLAQHPCPKDQCHTPVLVIPSPSEESAFLRLANCYLLFAYFASVWRVGSRRFRATITGSPNPPGFGGYRWDSTYES
jgi:hypothetical protein